MSRAQAKIPRNAEWNLACEPEATPEQLTALSRSTNNTVRELVAKRKDLTRHLFEVLSEDAHDIVRLKIAKNTSAPRDILKKNLYRPGHQRRQICCKKFLNAQRCDRAIVPPSCRAGQAECRS